MVKNTRGRTTRLVLSLIVVVAVGVAVAAAVTTRTSSPEPAHAPTTPTPTTGTAPSTGTAPTTTPVKHAPRPLGMPGRWKLIFDSGFTGRSLNRGIWNAHDGWSNQNAVSDSRDNVAVRNGHVILTLASDSSGAELGTRHFSLEVGDFAEARIRFAGSGRRIYNWPAWWLSGPNWPRGGENDIAEGFGALTVNYHSPSVTLHSGPVPGRWANHFHIFGIYRARYFARVYWDGKVVGAYHTDDDGAPETMLLTLGAGTHPRTGAAGAMVVDYVRAWAPAGSAHR